MATDDQTRQAITAVRNGNANRDQEEIARRAATQAGAMGNQAREAFKGK